MFTLSEPDYRLFREMVQAHQRTRANGSQVGLGGQLDEGFQASDVFVARTPSGGIPGLEQFAGTSPDEPGSAVCQVYKITQVQGVGDYRMVKIPGLTKTVFNLSARDVAGYAWVPILKTKGGPWIVVNDPEPTSEDTGTGTAADPDNVTGGGECTLARLNSDDCLIATGPDSQSVLLRRTGAKTWTSVAEMRYPNGAGTGTHMGGTGTLSAVWNATTARMDLSLDGILLQNCGNGCYTGSWLTGHVNDLDDTTPCNGLAFTVCLACKCCPAVGFTEEGWYCVVTGTGTGTEASNCEALYLTVEDACDVEICSGPYATAELCEAACGTILTELCAADCGGTFLIPATLYITAEGVGNGVGDVTMPVSLGSGISACFYNPTWSPNCPYFRFLLAFSCTSGIPRWQVRIFESVNPDCSLAGLNATTSVGANPDDLVPGGCTPTRPVDWTGTNEVTGSCALGAYPVTLRVTETPP
jgi:hypothetical protein